MKDSVTAHLTPREKRAAIDMALEGGMEPADIFKAITANVFGPTERRALIVAWGKKMGLESSAALQIARDAGLIPTTHPPRSK
jgi:hypothetical protein